MEKIKYLSPLRYPGSKKKIVAYLIKIINSNKLNPHMLVEPFVGGGSVMLNFLITKVVQKAIIADKDKLIYSFWYVVFNNPKCLVNFIKRVAVSVNNFYKFKSIAKNYKKYDKETLAKACLFLNRTSFSGMLADRVGPLGGKEQKSRYKIDCRFNKVRIIEKINLISAFRKSVTVLPHDWRKTIEYAVDWAKRKKKTADLFFYFDPPFYNKADDLYRFWFDINEHKAFYTAISRLKHKWVLSYDNAPEIKKMYSQKKYIKTHIETPYSINSHAKRIEKELIITPLSLPDITKYK